MEGKFRISYLPLHSPVSEHMLGRAWDRMEAEGLWERVFHDGSVKTRQGFLDEVLRPGSLPFMVTREKEFAALSWLNCIVQRTARVHFVIFREYWGRERHREIGALLYSHILTRRDAGGYLFDCLYGITPATNPLAWRAALNCGWRKAGVLPQGCFIAAKNKSVDGIITCATREILGIGGAGA